MKVFCFLEGFPGVFASVFESFIIRFILSLQRDLHLVLPFSRQEMIVVESFEIRKLGGLDGEAE